MTDEKPTMAYVPPVIEPPPYNPESRYATVSVVNQNYNETPLPSSDMTNKLTIAYQYCRSVKTFAFIDLIFGIFYFFFYWPYIFANILILFGFYGGKNYKKNYLIGYSVFAVLTIFFRIYLFWYEPEMIFKIVYMLFAIIEIYIFRFILKAYNSLKILSEREISILQSGWEPTIVVFRYY